MLSIIEPLNLSLQKLRWVLNARGNLIYNLHFALYFGLNFTQQISSNLCMVYSWTLTRLSADFLTALYEYFTGISYHHALEKVDVAMLVMTTGQLNQVTYITNFLCKNVTYMSYDCMYCVKDSYLLSCWLLTVMLWLVMTI